jgi:hypothetical protein
VISGDRMHPPPRIFSCWFRGIMQLNTFTPSSPSLPARATYVSIIAALCMVQCSFGRALKRILLLSYSVSELVGYERLKLFQNRLCFSLKSMLNIAHLLRYNSVTRRFECWNYFCYQV